MDAISTGLAALSAGSGIFSALSAKRGQEDANAAMMAFNAQEAQKQRDWAEGLSNTAFQRARRDLEAAGYNPLLALGHSAVTPSGASARAELRSETSQSSQHMITTAKQAADVVYLRALADTERSKQRLNDALASGRVGIPGFGSIPVSTAKDIADKMKKGGMAEAGANLARWFTE